MQQTIVKIGGREISQHAKPFIIAEMSGNHNQSLDRALKLVDAAAEAGACALKIQTYTADTMTINSRRDEFIVKDGIWDGKTLYELYQEAYTPWEWHEPIMRRCIERKMIFFSTPFDESAVDFLETLKVNCYKIASFELTDTPLIRKICATKKPIIMSTGMANLEEIEEAVHTAREFGCDQLILLKCTSAYPASAKDANLQTMTDLRERFGVEVGLSDHTLGVGVAVSAVALGASVVEKHFTLNRNEGGVDSAFSLNPDEFKTLVSECNNARDSIGNISYAQTTSEKSSRMFRRSIYFVKSLRKNEVVRADHLKIIRPANGIAPKYYDQLIGKTVQNDIEAGTPTDWNCFEP